MKYDRKVRIAFAGGGRRIGRAHQISALMDNQAELVAGCFSRDPERNREIAAELFVPPERTYASIEELAEKEAARPEDERVDVVSIITPNGQHFPCSRLFLQAGFHVICEKPMTCTLAQARRIVSLVESTGLVFALTHNYTGNLLVRQVRAMVRSGEMGDVSRVIVEYLQGGDRISIPNTPGPIDPETTSAGGSISDIGTHAFNLLEYITDDRVAELSCDLTDVSGRCAVPRDGGMLVRMEGGAKGTLTCSQIAPGEANNLNFRLYADKGAVEWRQNRPEVIRLTREGVTEQTVWRGRRLADPLKEQMRAWPAHPEGYLEAFANIYRGAYQAVHAHRAGSPLPPSDYDCPNVYDGLRAMLFVEAALKSARNGSAWVKLSDL